jgi:hypothetical protein
MGMEIDFCQNTLTNHFTRYPAIQTQDIYKLLHQAALGSDHAVRDEQEAKDWLERELAEMGEGPDDPLLDPISPDGQILRIHLRPYLRAGRDPENLLRAFIHTANEWQGSPELLKEYADTVAGMMLPVTSQFSPEDFKAFFSKMETQGFPAVHHSEVYKRLYRPAYRVVARQYLEEK